MTEDAQVQAWAYTVTEVNKAEREFQKHALVTLEVKPEKVKHVATVGSVLVSTAQPLGHLAAYLLEPQSEDGLEKIMQSVTVNLAWPVVAGAHETSITLEIRGGLDEKLLGDAASEVASVPAD